MKNLLNIKYAVAAVLSPALAIPLGAPAYGASGAGAEAAGVVTVEVIAANGSGCAPGTATVTGNADDTGFRVRYRDFIAEAGGDASATDRRKNCQVSVLVSIPSGWTIAIAEATYRGRANLYSGASGLHRTTYYWQGSSQSDSVSQTFTGPRSDSWSTTQVAGVLHYQPCDTQSVLNINTELRVDAGTSTRKNSLSMRTSDGDVDTLFNYSLTPC
ncbi:DUF4360 domain-containing protein [Actinoplanes regularis]|uniref:DUF4360 domain-containing protein n=1 Tax=Actinoplanes regularis TaxID=52697 RepID=UPI00249F960F|nr:DUF4360 domain-containing protein [Actinoplanes regularis]GLW34526.1 hypothetical protein Areg01_74630 [Actinoplanes regularis]